MEKVVSSTHCIGVGLLLVMLGLKKFVRKWKDYLHGEE